MKFSTREEIEAPLDHVWAQVTNCEEFERHASRRGARVARNDPDGGLGVGTDWEIEVSFRNKPRRIEAEVVEFDAPHSMVIESRAGGVDGTIVVTLVALGPSQTRLEVSVDMKPANISGRLLIQSLKFAKGTLNRRFEDRISAFGKGIRTEYRQAS